MVEDNTDYFAEVRRRVVLSEYVQSVLNARLTSRGPGKFSGPCPVHGGDNPTAFTVDDERGLWHCFTHCDPNGGDIFTLWSITNGKPVSEKGTALRALAEHVGIDLPQSRRPASRDELHRALSKAARLFHEVLVSETPTLGETEGAQQAYDWLTEERSVSDEQIDLAQIGFVPDSRDLRAALERLVAPREILIQAGILTRSERTGSVFCPYGGRLVFPIRNERGKVVGFGARVVPGVTERNTEAKFINTRATDVYDKSSALYGIDLVTDQVRRVVVCEGYMDAIAVNSLDDDSVVGVAACGTALTPSHVSMLLDVLPSQAQIVLTMDSDSAGRKAIGRLTWAVPMLNGRGFGILLDGDAGKDPWERHLAGTLAADISAQRQIPLVDAITEALFYRADDEESFDSALAEAIAGAGAANADDFIRRGAHLRKVPVAEYSTLMRKRAIRVRSSRTSRSKVTLSAPARVLISRILHAESLEVSALANALPRSSRKRRRFANTWLPIVTDADFDALEYVIFGHEDADEDVVASVAGCLGDDTDISIGPLLRGLSRKVLLESSGRVADMGPASSRRARVIRTMEIGEVAVEDELAYLLLLIDHARALDDLDA